MASRVGVDGRSEDLEAEPRDVDDPNDADDGVSYMRHVICVNPRLSDVPEQTDDAAPSVQCPGASGPALRGRLVLRAPGWRMTDPRGGKARSPSRSTLAGDGGEASVQPAVSPPRPGDVLICHDTPLSVSRQLVSSFSRSR